MQAYQKENEYVPPNPAAPPKQSAKKAVAQWNGADMGLGTVLTLEMVELSLQLQEPAVPRVVRRFRSFVVGVPT